MGLSVTIPFDEIIREALAQAGLTEEEAAALFAANRDNDPDESDGTLRTAPIQHPHPVECDPWKSAGRWGEFGTSINDSLGVDFEPFRNYQSTCQDLGQPHFCARFIERDYFCCCFRLY